MHASCIFKYVSLQTCVNLSHRFLTALANAPDSSLFFLRSDLTITAHEHGVYSTNFARLFFRKNTSVTMLVTNRWPYTLLIHPSPQLQASCPQKHHIWIRLQKELGSKSSKGWGMGSACLWQSSPIQVREVCESLHRTEVCQFLVVVPIWGKIISMPFSRMVYFSFGEMPTLIDGFYCVSYMG